MHAATILFPRWHVFQRRVVLRYLHAEEGRQAAIAIFVFLSYYFSCTAKRVILLLRHEVRNGNRLAVVVGVCLAGRIPKHPIVVSLVSLYHEYHFQITSIAFQSHQ